ncbi:MAG: SMP-30/gluconolactonase/LRE family protein [Methylacidiphilales bacterium]|nr:SMP-30/gluconolactonase/LRE family protein [Candidatus Methylacidiphilales bacterium]
MNPRSLLHFALSFALLAISQNPVSAHDPGLIQPGAEIRYLAGGFRFAEGPACDSGGNLYFSDIPNNRIYIWTLNGDLKLYREKSNAANGLYFDSDGSLLVCEGAGRRLIRDNLNGQLTPLADSYEGKKLNSPNDLWVDPAGGIYFSDPRYGKTDDLEQDGMHVYYLPKDGKLRRVTDDLIKPNGLAGTPDGKKLYISDEGAKRVWVYTIVRGGNLRNKRLFAEQDCDGMTLDDNGNVYMAGKKVAIYSPEGVLLECIQFPEQPSNVTFGGKNHKTLFVTARTSLYSIDLQVSGAYKALPPPPRPPAPEKSPK